jgi:hypothetical protein
VPTRNEKNTHKKFKIIKIKYIMKFVLYYGYTRTGHKEDNMKIFELHNSDATVPAAHNT